MMSIAFFWMSSLVFAASPAYDLKIELLLNGKHVSSPRLILKEGETATIIQKTKTVDNFIDVVAVRSKNQDPGNHENPENENIVMKFTVGEISKNGVKTILSQPQILTKENVPAQVTVAAQEKGPEKLSLSVVAKKKEL